MNKYSQLQTIFLMALSFALACAVQAADLETQTNRAGSVTVKVTPKNISAGAKSWDFEVSLNTHSVSLDQDMARTAVMIVDSNKPQAPLSWNGDPPGGHHRKGVLGFQPHTAMPQHLELHISGIGGVEKRVFRWALAK